MKKSFDDVLVSLGEFGRYQKRVYFLLFLPTIFSAMHKLSWVFLGAKTPHRCRLPGEPEDATFVVDPNFDSPFTVVDSCSYNSTQGDVFPCDNGWVYDRSVFGSSAVMDWDLVCEDKGWRAVFYGIDVKLIIRWFLERALGKGTWHDIVIIIIITDLCNLP